MPPAVLVIGSPFLGQFEGWVPGMVSRFVIMSGSNCNLDLAGRYVRLPVLGVEGHKTLGNCYTTLLNAHGNPIEHYGDLDLEMALKKLLQTGAIKQFMGRVFPPERVIQNNGLLLSLLRLSRIPTSSARRPGLVAARLCSLERLFLQLRASLSE